MQQRGFGGTHVQPGGPLVLLRPHRASQGGGGRTDGLNPDYRLCPTVPGDPESCRNAGGR